MEEIYKHLAVTLIWFLGHGNTFIKAIQTISYVGLVFNHRGANKLSCTAFVYLQQTYGNIKPLD